MKGFLLGILIAFLTPKAWKELNDRDIPVPLKPCQVTVTNATARPVFAVPMADGRRFALREGVHVAPRQSALLRLASGECEKIPAYPQGPIWAIAAVDPDTQAIRSIRVLTGRLMDVTITETSGTVPSR